MSADSRRFKVGLFHRRETVSPCDQNRTKLCGTWLKPGLFEHRAFQRQSTPQIDLRVRAERAALRTTRLFYGSAEAFSTIYHLYSDTLRPQSLKPHFEPPNQEIQGAACTLYFLKATLQTGLQGSLRDLSCAHSPTSSFNVRQDCQSDSIPLKLNITFGLPKCSERLLVPNSQSEISMSGTSLLGEEAIRLWPRIVSEQKRYREKVVWWKYTMRHGESIGAIRKSVI